ncbi:hypothetical protein TURU_082093 [Turdus rufiventris]|nr:hypothetical protein TURU_082093 [Turdus rufiventris]
MIEACTKIAELFSAPERNPGPAQAKSAAAVTPRPKKQQVPPQQLQHITCFQCKKTENYARRLPTQSETEEDQQTKKLGVQRVPAINTITRKDISIEGSTLVKASLFKTKGEDGTNGVGIQDNINVKCSINKGWKPLGRFSLMTTKGFHSRSAEWTIITVDLSNTSLDVMLLHMKLHCEYSNFTTIRRT